MGNLKTSLIVIGVILIFVSGFVLGRLSSDNGRYSYRIFDEQLVIFDSKTGKLYVKNSNEKTKYIMVDIINAERKEYKGKAKKN